jgi:hypothetical protein
VVKSLTIVTHCWRFSRVLAYQLSSLVLHPPKKIRVKMLVFYNKEDAPTAQMLRWFSDKMPVECVWYSLPLPELFNRTIGRNKAATECSTDAIWFCDADYFFGDGCLDALVSLDAVAGRLFYPSWSWINRTHELGDQYALRVTGPGLWDIDPADFERHEYRKAIGGLQIVRGSVARAYGYCRGDGRRLRPVLGGWKQTSEDSAYRKTLGTDGVPIELPGLYRIRQLVQWRVDTL